MTKSIKKESDLNYLILSFLTFGFMLLIELILSFFFEIYIYGAKLL